ncbi:hypothetical protein AWH56_020400 [Anaerobacillus isosaccharinicus]|uniref:Uncharacterized protein n=1 Tax=Anaerobacillus isosaccharinicus TaxID=1532552 RepID=A0A1S2KXU8_9BACI|nr:hypothetical protein [Anaerobacillus isosaccharinicus]MBA5586731.1 hypothetical protein [Anaerobacillus isosaccharinicus]QOY35047.1 hypothetical protein AWH56_020400 [Anaerobacillus isosaccharinicus]
MKFLKIIVLIIILGSISIVPQKTHATLYAYITYEEMVERADLIVIGKNAGEVNVRTEKVPDPEIHDYTLGFTEWKIEVSSYLKGNSEGEHILVSTPGPSVDENDEITKLITRSNEYRLDELIEGIEKELVTKVKEILFFLEERDGYYHPINPNAIVPLNIIYWQDHINLDIVNVEEIEQKLLEELEFLQTYLKDTPHYSADDKLQKPIQFNWYPFIMGIFLIFLFILYFTRKKRKK